DLWPFLDIVPAFVAGEHHGLERYTVGCRSGRDTHRVADRPAAELKHDVFAQKIEKLVHLAGMDAARSHRHELVERGPVLVEEDAVLEPHRIELLAADVVVALRRRGIAFELADHGPRMD